MGQNLFTKERVNYETTNRFLSLVLALSMLVSMIGMGIPALPAAAAEANSAMALTVGTEMEASISKAGQSAYFSFTLDQDGVYIFSSNTDLDTLGYLFDADMNLLEQDDDGGTQNNFCVAYELTAGTPYIYGVKFYNLEYTGTFMVLLEQSPLASVEIDPLSIIEGTTGDFGKIWDYESDQCVGHYFKYWWWEKMTYTLTFIDGTVSKGCGTSFKYNGNTYRMSWNSS